MVNSLSEGLAVSQEFERPVWELSSGSGMRMMQLWMSR